MKKIILGIGVVFSFVGCESSEGCNCEVYTKIYDDKGEVIEAKYFGTREGRCEDITDKDEVTYYYQSVNC